MCFTGINFHVKSRSNTSFLVNILTVGKQMVICLMFRINLLTVVNMNEFHGKGLTVLKSNFRRFRPGIKMNFCDGDKDRFFQMFILQMNRIFREAFQNKPE